MTELLTAAQMRAIEQAAIDSGAVTGRELMERAGRGVVEAIFEEWPDLAATSHRAVVLCGPGNNGGDGFVVARLLKERGWDVEVFLYGDAGKLPPDARVNFERWLQYGVPSDLKAFEVEQGSAIDQTFGLPVPAVIVDAMFGSGINRPFSDLDKLRKRIASIASFNALSGDFPRVVSIDVPSGLESDSGRYLGDHGSNAEHWDSVRICSNLTVTFETPFIGHHLCDGPLSSGKTVTKSIGLIDRPAPGLRVRLGRSAPPGFLGKSAPYTPAHRRSNKFHHGHALILSGPSGKGGAARLAARGALRIGAGLVTIGCPPSALHENSARLDAIMLTSLHGESEAAALAETLQDGRINAVCVGPGLGLDRARALVPVALGVGGVKPRPSVLDADALSCFEPAPGELFGMLHSNCVLTPHRGEFARLFPDIAEKLAAPANSGPAYSKVDATREAAARAGCLVLLKGPDTVIADPDGRCTINSAHYDRAAPWLATAGSGDVLAGFITGLLARGFDPMSAAETAAWLHVECALAFGPGLIAEDLPEALPRVFRALGL